MKSSPVGTRKANGTKPSIRFEAVKIEPLFEILDAVAWLDSPGCKEIAQFAGVDPRTAGKVLKNARQIGLVDSVDEKAFLLAIPYPFKGSLEQKRSVVREALLKNPLVVGVRQFLALGNDLPSALRKAATIVGETNYDAGALGPLVSWANSFDALDLKLRHEGLLENAVAAKRERQATAKQRVVFISHSSKDKAFVRQLASDLVSRGVRVWLDEQRIRVGDSIPEKVNQGLAESDFLLIVLSKNAMASEWVKREMNSALVKEIERRRVVVLPVKLDDCEVPSIIADKKYADFTTSYEHGLAELTASFESMENNSDD